MDINEQGTRFENLELERNPKVPVKQQVPCEDHSAHYHYFEPARTRRLRKKKKTRRGRQVTSDGFFADDEDEYVEETRLPENMSSTASISQRSGLTNFSSGVQFSPSAESEDQEVFSFSQSVDPDVMIDAFLYKKVLRDRDGKPPRKRYRKRRRCVSEEEIGRSGYQGRSRSRKGGQYQAPSRAYSVDVWLADFHDEPPGLFPNSTSSSVDSIEERRRQVDPGMLGEGLPRYIYYPAVLPQQIKRATSEPLLVATPSSSESLDGRPRNASRARRKWRRRRPRSENAIHSVGIESPDRDGLESCDMEWDSGESSMPVMKSRVEDSRSTWLEPTIMRKSHRSSSVPEIMVEEWLPPDRKTPRGRRIHSIGGEKDFDLVSCTNIPESAAQFIHPSTEASILSLAKSRPHQNLRTELLRRKATTGVVCPLTQRYVVIHNTRVIGRSDNDSCYNSTEMASQSQHTPMRPPRTQFLRYSSSGEIPQTNPSYSHCGSLFSRTSSTLASRSASAHGTIHGYRNEACPGCYSSRSEEVHVELEASLSVSELTVNQGQGEENQVRTSSGQRAYIKIIKCVVVSVIVLIVLICVLILTL